MTVPIRRRTRDVVAGLVAAALIPVCLVLIYVVTAYAGVSLSTGLFCALLGAGITVCVIEMAYVTLGASE